MSQSEKLNPRKQKIKNKVQGSWASQNVLGANPTECCLNAWIVCCALLSPPITGWGRKNGQIRLHLKSGAQ